MGHFTGKLALVTGAAKNVGKVIARELAARGAHVLLNYFHSHDAAQHTKRELESLGARVDLFRASVALERQVDRMFDEIRDKYGYLDILVNNAASGALVPFEDVTEAALDKALNTNFKGSLWCSRRAAPLMAARGGGAIVNISALGSAQLVMANYLACGPAKAAVEALTRYLAAELAPLNIRVNTASAGMLAGHTANSFPRAAEMQQVVLQATPLGRLGQPEDLARIVAFLASDDAGWITGQVVLADGGLSLGSTLLSPPTARQPHRAAPTIVRTDAEGVEDDIAIVGMGLVVPGANDPEQFWRSLLEGGDLFIDIPKNRWDNEAFVSTDLSAEDKTYSRKSAFVMDFKPCDELRQRDGDTLDDHELTTLWLRHSLLQALRHVKRRDEDRCACVIGYTADGSQHLEEAALVSGVIARCSAILDRTGTSSPEQQALLAEITQVLNARYPRAAPSPSRFLPHRVGHNVITNILPPDTEVAMVDTACSSSLYAIDIGLKGLRMGKHDIAICGGAFALAPRNSVLFSKLRGLSTMGEVRAFDKTSDGVLFADGAGIVVLKTRRRALEDGDDILALIKAFGASSDGKGKAIYAPSSAGQTIAVERALSSPGVTSSTIDWIIAHATGTPAGDLAEFTTLRQMIAPGRRVYVTSNKSLIGHTAWAAGVVSTIQGILGLRKALIPPQHRFREAPPAFEIDKTHLTIPTQAIAWPSKAEAPRAVSISGFGFGGTNAHLILEEHKLPMVPPRIVKREPAERIAIVAWAANVPGLPTRQEVERWLRGEGTAPHASFGDRYPTPGFDKVRMPPSVVRTIDRCQLMALECAHDLKDRIGAFWEKSRARTGVFMGHMGPTRNAVLYAGRCYLDEIDDLLRQRGGHGMTEVVDGLRAEVRRLVEPANEDSYPGVMPNVIPGRVANYFDLNGPNMTLDAGFSSAFAAVDVASRYLRSHDVDLALVGGINGNTTPEMQHFAADLPLPAETVLAEGAFLLALVTEATAQAAGLAVLGFLEEGSRDDSNGDAGSIVRCGFGSPDRHSYLGGEGALAILRALHQPRGRVVITCSTEEDHRSRSLIVSLPAMPAQTSAGLTPVRVVPREWCNDREYASGKPLIVRRHVETLKPFPLVADRPPQAILPPHTLVITDRVEVIEALGGAADICVMSTTPVAMAGPRRCHLPVISPETVRAHVAGLDMPIEHIRLITVMDGVPRDAVWDQTDSLVALHDLAFLALQRCRDGVIRARGSFISLFLGAMPSGCLHPFAGLFGGLVKCAALEMPDCLAFALFTDSVDVNTAASQVVQESTGRRFLPCVVYEGDCRKAMFFDPVEATLPPDTAVRLTADSVVVAVAGARGITAEIVKALAEHIGPRLYVIGSNPLDSYPRDIFEGTDEEFGARRQQYIREERKRHPEKHLRAIDQAFERLVDARVARQNLLMMERFCGRERVQYLQCDIRDLVQVQRTVARILGDGHSIDLLINAAGLNRSAPIVAKAFDEFRSVRDVKLKGYLNLKQALRDAPPRLWCNFGSLVGAVGQTGEVDYASGNDFLASAARYAQHVLGREEFTIGWTLWGMVGLAAKPLVKAYYEKSGLYSTMATGEGIHHFLRELHQTPPPPSTAHLGAAEEATIDRIVPGLLRPLPVPVANAPAEFYVGPAIARGDDEIVFERVFDLATDSYLHHHLVNGDPTLPGTFVTEMAAEAAARLTPGLDVIAFEQMEFHRFLKVHDKGTPSPRKIRAVVVDRSADQTVVRIEISEDVRAPNGRLLVRDRVHFALNVILARQFPDAPRWEGWDAIGERPVPDPYHLPASPVRLSGMFASTTNTRVHPLGKRAEYRIELAPGHPIFSKFRVPVLLLDGLARMIVLSPVDEVYVPLLAPRAIRRIDVYERTNDCELATVAGIQLFSTPRESEPERVSGHNRCVAIRPDGRMIAQIKDISGVVLGYLHCTSGAFLTVTEMAARRAEGARVAVESSR